MLKKRMVSVLLALAMCLSLAAPAVAVSEKTDITTMSAEEASIMRTYEELRWNMDHLVGTEAQPTYVGEAPQALVSLHEANSEAALLSARSLDFVMLKGNEPVYKSAKDSGGYYYAYSPMSTGYSSCYVNIKFPTSLYTANSTRTAFVSLGITGSKGGIDIGFTNKGSGWYPYHYDTQALEGSRQGDYEDKMAPANVTNAAVTLRALTDKQIRMGVQYLDASGNNVGEFFYVTVDIASGNLTYVNGKVNCRFYRFASLIPSNGVTTTNYDGTYMKNGNMLYCQLYDGSQYVTWGILSPRVDCAWLVSPNNITVTNISDRNETFSITYF